MEEASRAAIARDAVRGGGLLGLRQVFAQVLNLAGYALLARLLGPAEIGVLGIVLFVFASSARCGGAGLQASLIRLPDEPTADEYRAVFTLQEAIMGVVALARVRGGAVARRAVRPAARGGVALSPRRRHALRELVPGDPRRRARAPPRLRRRSRSWRCRRRSRYNVVVVALVWIGWGTASFGVGARSRARARRRDARRRSRARGRRVRCGTGDGRARSCGSARRSRARRSSSQLKDSITPIFIGLAAGARGGRLRAVGPDARRRAALGARWC